MGTLKKRIEDPDEIANPNVVKVVTDLAATPSISRALPIPFARDGDIRRLTSSISGCMCTGAIFCCAIPDLPVVRWNRRSGWSNCARSRTVHRIRVVETEYDSLGVDTPEDLERVSACCLK